MSVPDLSAAAQAAEQVRKWQSKRDTAIRAARATGASLRAIAEATGLSHTAVAKIERRI